MDISGKIALVTGSSRGLGRTIALALAESGAHVLINYYKSRDKAEEVVDLIRKMGRTSEAFRADVTNSEAVGELAHSVLDKYRQVDILINNAGAIIRPGVWDILKNEQLDQTININLKSTMLCLQEFVPSMIENKLGRIVNITTTYAITGAAPILAYTASKAGIITITYAMARELGKHGITVNAVAPGNFDTDMTAQAGDAVNQWAISTTPLGRLGHPHEVGEAVVFLVRADFITGHVLVVDGGQLLNM